MQRRALSLSSLLVLVIALVACTSAFAASPAEDVYNPDGQVLDFIATPTPTAVVDDSSDCGSGNSGSSNSGSNGCSTETTVSTCVSGSGSAGCGEVESADNCGSNGSGSASSSGSAACATTPGVGKGQLPFTGFQAGLVAMMGLALLGGGVAMRRFSRQD